MQKQFVLWRFSGSSAISLRLPFVENAFDKGAKHWLLLHEHNGRWFWGTIFFLWCYWFCKGQSVYQSNQPHPMIGYTEGPCQDSWSWPSSSVPSRIFQRCWCILLLQNLTQQQHICCQTISTNMSNYCSLIVKRTTTTFFQILFGHQWASTKVIWAKGGNW